MPFLWAFPAFSGSLSCESRMVSGEAVCWLVFFAIATRTGLVKTV